MPSYKPYYNIITVAEQARGETSRTASTARTSFDGRRTVQTVKRPHDVVSEETTTGATSSAKSDDVITVRFAVVFVTKEIPAVVP